MGVFVIFLKMNTLGKQMVSMFMDGFLAHITNKICGFENIEIDLNHLKWRDKLALVSMGRKFVDGEGS